MGQLGLMAVIVADDLAEAMESAAAIIGPLFEHLEKLRSQTLFKKIESTLCSKLIPETAAALQASGRSHLLLRPAVPPQGRTLSGGRLNFRVIPLEAWLSSAIFAHRPQRLLSMTFSGRFSRRQTSARVVMLSGNRSNTPGHAALAAKILKRVKIDFFVCPEGIRLFRCFMNLN